jgi:hypothetical protein
MTSAQIVMIRYATCIPHTATVEDAVLILLDAISLSVA